MDKDAQCTAQSGALYGMGFLGALVYFISHAGSFWLGLWGIVKSVFWPAFLVFEAFKHFLM